MALRTSDRETDKFLGLCICSVIRIFLLKKPNKNKIFQKMHA